MKSRRAATVIGFLLLVTTPSAQQRPSAPSDDDPARNVGPAGAMGVDRVVLPAEPQTFDTAEQHKIRVVVIAKGFAHPWALIFLPDGRMLVTERAGRLRIVRNGVLETSASGG